MTMSIVIEIIKVVQSNTSLRIFDMCRIGSLVLYTWRTVTKSLDTPLTSDVSMTSLTFIIDGYDEELT